ncbi:exonuclease domain-containing protein [Gaiella occulta]|uniref:exonuclease domain-containing protein n=1 Tax=Gaiella occulta TaxID=1002870 RepID=UPI0015F0E021|nr:exonuclease domain-containing protein [Gaiella occulta]
MSEPLHPGLNQVGDEWVVIDFETASSRGTPCQVAALRFRDGTEVDRFTSLIYQAPDSFYPFNVALHGISPEMVEDAPTWPEVCGELVRFTGASPLVSHYAPFDMGVVRDACDFCEIEWPSLRYTCTVSISRRVWPGMQSYSLPLLCTELGLSVDEDLTHDALYDSRLAAEILGRAITAKGATGLDDLLSKIWLFFGEVAPDGWFGSRARANAAGSIPEADLDADPDSPFFGKVVVFTGELAMVRRNAWQAVAAAGGQPSNNVSKKTNMLICGYQDMLKLAVGKTKSHKLQRVEELHADGEHIEILTERDFFRLLGGIERPQANV